MAETTEFLLNQCACWPGLEVQDLLKGLHQSVFGCGHFVGEDSRARLLEELKQLSPEEIDRGIEPLDGPFCRVHLQHLAACGLSAETLHRLFVLSGETASGGIRELEGRLAVLERLAREGRLPFSAGTVEREIDRWQQAGYPVCSHSLAVEERYHPHYRVVRRDLAQAIPLLGALDGLLEKGGGIAAIDGGSASGKTTLAAWLERIYDCRVFHMDDFFLRPYQRTAERLGEPGGNVDWERFLEEVLLPVRRGETVHLRRYDCHTQRLLETEEQPPKALTVVEGAYSMHPELAGFYDFAAFLAITPELQHRRIRLRNDPESQQMFFNQWIPLEQRYFMAADVPGRCDLVLEVEP